MSDCNHWPGQNRCEVCGMGRTGFERALLHAIEQSRKGHWLNVAAALSEGQQVALRELSEALKRDSITAVAVAEKSPPVTSESPDVAEKSPPVTSVIPGREMTKAERAAARERIAPSPRIDDGDECSICRRTHGLEVIHACE